MATSKTPDDGPESLEEATRKGYIGTTPDDTPDSAYSVAGVTSGAKTPETQAPGSAGSTKADPDKVGTGTPGR